MFFCLFVCLFFQKSHILFFFPDGCWSMSCGFWYSCGWTESFTSNHLDQQRSPRHSLHADPHHLRPPSAILHKHTGEQHWYIYSIFPLVVPCLKATVLINELREGDSPYVVYVNFWPSQVQPNLCKHTGNPVFRSHFANTSWQFLTAFMKFTISYSVQ